MSDLTRFSVSLESDLLADFDALCKKRGYANRSEALRHCIRRELMEEAVAQPGSHVAGILTLLYNHHDSDLPRRLTAMQHEAHDTVLATLHVHLDLDHCLEVMTLKGKSEEVQDLADKLCSARGVHQGHLSMTPMEQHCHN